MTRTQSHRWRLRIEAWAATRDSAWTVRDSGNKYVVCYFGRRVLLCADTRKYVNVFAIGKKPDEFDEGLRAMLLGRPRHDASYGGTTVWLRPESIEDFLIGIAETVRGTAASNATPVRSEGDSPSGSAERPTELSQQLRHLLEPAWPHAYEHTIASVQPMVEFTHHRPVYFVGNVEAIAKPLVVFVGNNPNIRTGDTEECQFIDGPFPDYWLSRIEYFRSASFNWAHYKTHAAFLAGLVGGAAAPDVNRGAELLNALAIAVELCPLSSPETGDIFKHLDAWQQTPAHPTSALARRVLFIALEVGRPVVAVTRYDAAFQYLAARHRADKVQPPEVGDHKVTILQAEGRHIPLVSIGNRDRRADQSGRAFRLGRTLREVVDVR